jgi:predicted dehydrogenase
MAPIGVGVIGCGDIARVRYFPEIAAAPELELAGVHTRSPAAGEAAVAQHGGRFHRSLDDFLADPRIEAVIIASPHPAHADQAVRALHAGRHVLVEKPFATSLADAERVRRAAEAGDRVFMPLPFDDLPPMLEARRLIEAGAVGRVSAADAVLAHGGPVHAPWFFDRQAAGWGVLADLGVYLFSQLTFLFGPASRVAGEVTTVFPERTGPDGRTFRAGVEDNVAATLAWPGGVVGTVRANWCSAADRRNFIWEVRIHGTDGILFITMARPEGALVVYHPGGEVEGAAATVHNGMTGCWLPALPPWDHHRDIVRAFAAAIGRAGSDPPDRVSLAHQHHVIEIIERLYEASRTGTTQRLQTTF